MFRGKRWVVEEKMGGGGEKIGGGECLGGVRTMKREV